MDKSSQEIATVDTKAQYGTRKKIDGTRKITYKAILVAMAMALKLVGQVFTFGSFKISFVYIPWIVAAIVMGPIGGMAVIAITDFIGTLILQTGGFPLPLILLSNSLFGLFMGFAFKIPKLDPRLKLLVGTIVVIPVCTLGLTSYALASASHSPFLPIVSVRLGTQVPVVILNVVIVAFLFPLLRKLKLMD